MTGVGSYYYIVWAIWLRHCLNERQDEYMLNWSSLWALPEVIPIPAGTGKLNGTTLSNGQAKRAKKAV